MRLIYTIIFIVATLTTYLPAELLSLKGKLDIGMNEPHYSEGALVTNKGGIIKGEDFFLQATDIVYTKKNIDGEPVDKIEAFGNLYMKLKDRVYTGEKVDVDLIRNMITIYNGCTTTPPWFIGGKKIELHPDGTGIIYDGYMTTSENMQNDWSVEADKVFISNDSKIKARNVRFLFVRVPFLWIPTLSQDLKRTSTAPFRYRVRWGGNAGVKLGVTYDLYKSKTFKTQVLLDFGLRSGIGGGFTTRYKNREKPAESLYTYNYIAHDIPSNAKQYLRYRLQGRYLNTLFKDKINFRVTYDKLSDLKMRVDYTNNALISSRILPTEMNFSRKTSNWISSLNTKIRINDFQSVKQQLPLFLFNNRPIRLGMTGWILDNKFSAGYLDYKYSRQSVHVHNFHSSRIQLAQNLYKSYSLGALTTTPEVGYTIISYSNSPTNTSELQALAKFGFESHLRFIRPAGRGAQSLEPYVQYQYLTTPHVRPDKHYVFDIEDGFYRLNTLRFGFRNSLLQKDVGSSFTKKFYADIYGRAFFDTNKIPTTIPKIYIDSRISPTSNTTYGMDFAYDLYRNFIDHINLRGNFTINEDVALGLEWRKRSPYAFRKLDPDNFVLDAFRNNKTLRHSRLSDKRDTLLAHLFIVITPTLSFDIYTMHGWKRPHQPAYNEYGVDVKTLIRGALQVTLSYNVRASNHTYALYFSLGGKRSTGSKSFSKFGQGNYDN